MQHYFFDLLANGTRQEDDVGLDFATLNEVRYAAMSGLPAIAAEEVPKDGDHQHYTIMVKGEDGKPIYTATLTFAGLWLGPGGQMS